MITLSVIAIIAKIISIGHVISLLNKIYPFHKHIQTTVIMQFYSFYQKRKVSNRGD